MGVPPHTHSVVPPHTHGLDSVAVERALPGEPEAAIIGPRGVIGPQGPKAVISVVVLPSNPYTGYVEGDLVYLTTDKKVYRLADPAASGTTGWSRAVDGQDITAGTLIADQIYTGTLSAAVLLSGTIRTGAYPNDRVELDANGLRAYDGTNQVLDVPTDGSEVYVNAKIDASSVSVLGNLSVAGSGSTLEQGAVLALQSSVANPASAPTLSQAVQQFSCTSTVKGLFYDAAGGAGGATAVWWGIAGGTPNPNLIEILASDGSTNRSHLISSEFSASAAYAVAALGSYVYVLGKVTGTWRVAKYLKSDLTASPTLYDAVSFPIATPRYPVLAADGTYLYIADAAVTTGYISWNKYDGVMAKQGSTIATSSAPGGTTFQPGGLYTGNGDFGAWRLLIVGWNGTPSSAFAFDSTGTRQSSNDFTRDGGDADGIGYDGTYFHILKAGWGYLNRYSAIETGGVHWVGYSWYDSGGSDETTVGPRASITITARRFLSVTTPALPAGTTARRVYMKLNATDPGVTGLKLQSTSATQTTVLGDYNASGAADPASNNFPAGTAAEIKSAGGEWSLKGDGSSLFEVVQATGHAVVEDTTVSTTTTVSVAGNYYWTSLECSFTPAFTGQRHLILVSGSPYPDTAGTTTYEVRITDSADSTIVANFILTRGKTGTASEYQNLSGCRVWSSDGTSARKARVYVSHTTNGTVVTHGAVVLQVIPLP